MNAPGQSLLKVVSILFIVFGAIATVVSIVAILGSAVVTAAGAVADDSVAAVGGLLLIGSIFLLISSVLELVLGIVGVKKCGDPSKAGYFIVTGILLCMFSVLSIILSAAGGSFAWTGCIGFVLPILYIVGGNMNKKAAIAQ